MTDCETEVLIVGGGVAGLALAGFLDGTRFRPTVVESTPDGRRSGWAIGLRENGVAVLDALGVSDEAVERGSTPDEFKLRTPDGELVSACVEGTFLALHRDDLVGALRNAASDAEIRTGTAPIDIEPNEGSVKVGFDDGTEEYGIAVGADGVGSWVGGELFDRRVEAADTATWSFRVPDDGAEPPDSLVSVLAPGTGVIAGEVGRETLINLSTRMEDEAPNPPALGKLRDVAEEVGWRLPEYVDAPNRSSVYFRRDYEVTAPSWHTDRVALVGDAAHAVHPIVAMGATLALEDAYVLADELLSHDCVSDAFASFEKRRKERVARVRRAANVAERVAFAESSLVTAPRNLLTRAVPRFGFTAGLRAAAFTKPSLDDV